MFLAAAVALLVAAPPAPLSDAERDAATLVLARQMRAVGDAKGALFGGLVGLVSVDEATAPNHAELVKTAATLSRASALAKLPERKEHLKQAALFTAVAALQADKLEPDDAAVARVAAEVTAAGGDGAGLVVAWNVFSCASSQGQAKGNLRALYIAEESWRGEYDVYLTDMQKLGFVPKGDRYKFVVESVTPTSFRARAIGQGASSGTSGRSMRQVTPVAIKDRCAKK